MKRTALIIGTGGHCRVVLSLLAACDGHRVAGLVDIGEFRPGEMIMGVPVIGDAGCLENYPRESNLDVFLAIGDNGARKHWWRTMLDLGFELPNLISPTATVDPQANLGAANVVCGHAFIGPEALLGDNNLINTNAVVEHEVRIGSHCHLAPASVVAGRSSLGDGCFLGAGSIVIDGIAVATETTVGAGATVIRSISSPGEVHVGTPARVKRT